MEENVVVWMLGMLAAGFVAGFGAYETILRVSDQTTIPEVQKSELERSVAKVQELQAALDKLKAFEGAPPKSGTFVLASAVSANTPVDALDSATIGSTVFLFVRWVGLTTGGFYAQSWELRDNESSSMGRNNLRREWLSVHRRVVDITSRCSFRGTVPVLWKRTDRNWLRQLLRVGNQ